MNKAIAFITLMAIIAQTAHAGKTAAEQIGETCSAYGSEHDYALKAPEPVPSPFDAAQTAEIDPSDELAPSTLFLQRLSENNDLYSDEEISDAYKKVFAIARDERKPLEIRSRAYLLYSGILGIYAKNNNSSSAGKESFDALKTAVGMTPDSELAVSVYSKAVLDLSSRAYIIRKVIEIALETDMNTEVKRAIKLLEALPHSTETDTLLKKLKSKL